MPARKREKKLSRSEIVSLALRRCALACDPLNGHLKVLAKRLGVHHVTLSVWIKQGYIPAVSADEIERQFGKSNADAGILCPANRRR
jgi:hypothetical protein